MELLISNRYSLFFNEHALSSIFPLEKFNYFLTTHPDRYVAYKPAKEVNFCGDMAEFDGRVVKRDSLVN